MRVLVEHRRAVQSRIGLRKGGGEVLRTRFLQPPNHLHPPIANARRQHRIQILLENEAGSERRDQLLRVLFNHPRTRRAHIGVSLRTAR